MHVRYIILVLRTRPTDMHESTGECSRAESSGRTEREREHLKSAENVFNEDIPVVHFYNDDQQPDAQEFGHKFGHF